MRFAGAPKVQIVWEASVDQGAYKCVVTRSVSSGGGILTVTNTTTGEEILEQRVDFQHGAIFGPDVDDVAEWQAIAVKAINDTATPIQPRDILAEQIVTWIESSDAPYDYADKLISALDSAGYSIRQNKCSVPGCDAHDIYLTCVLHGLHIDNEQEN